jgi:hypothetical protein
MTEMGKEEVRMKAIPTPKIIKSSIVKGMM